MKGVDTEMKDISDMLANMMGEKDCSSVSALFLLNEEDKDDVSTKSISTEIHTADEQRNNLGTGSRRS